MAETKPTVMEMFAEYLRGMLKDEARELGISEVLRPFAIKLQITFEAARDAMYAAIAAHLVVLTDHYKLKPVG